MPSIGFRPSRRHSLRGLRAVLAAVASVAALAGAGEALARAPSVSDIPAAKPLRVVVPGAGATAAPVAVPATESLVSAARLSGDVGYALVDLRTGETLESRAAGQGFPPASVAKLVTALYALETLGPDHRFETRLVAGGPMSGGVLTGPLALVGGGDPELDTDALAELAAQARQRGLISVRGAFLADASALPSIPRIDPGQPEHVAYNPAVSALNLNFNRVLFEWQGAGAGRRLSMQARARRHSPEVSAISIALAPGGAPVFTRRDVRTDMGSEEAWQVSATALNRKGQRWLPVRRPEIYAGDAFRAVARDAGLVLPPPAVGAAAEGALLGRVASRPLRDIARSMLEHSTNLTAESLGLAASSARGVAPADLAASGAEMTRWAEERAGLPPRSGLDLRNHSGLAPDSRSSPLQMTAILRAAALRAPGPFAEPAAAAASTARLPARGQVSAKGEDSFNGSVGVRALTAAATPSPAPGPAGRGEAGLLEDLLKPVKLDGGRGESPMPPGVSAVAKTGTLHYVRGLAGYLTAASGRRFAFAIFSEDLERRAGLSNRDTGDGGARGWLGRAKRMEREMLRAWALRL